MGLRRGQLLPLQKAAPDTLALMGTLAKAGANGLAKAQLREALPLFTAARLDRILGNMAQLGHVRNTEGRWVALVAPPTPEQIAAHEQAQAAYRAGAQERRRAHAREYARRKRAEAAGKPALTHFTDGLPRVASVFALGAAL